jgi:hypothetical protein
MLTILRNIINQVNSEGFNCNLVIGHREVIAQYQADKPLFYFEMPTVTFDSETNETIYSLKYVLGINSEQNGNDVDWTFNRIFSLIKLNKLFMSKLKKYENENGQQLFIPEGVASIRTFADLQLLQHPTTGIFVELRFKALSNNFCEWQI